MKKFADKTVLITGATGLIGSNLVEKLLDEGAHIIALGRNQKKIEDVFEKYLSNPEFSYKVANISEGIPENIGNVDYIFHAASAISGAEIKTKPVDVIEANLIGARRCLDFLKNQKEQKGILGRMIIFSSATVYGGGYDTDKPVAESETGTADTLDNGNIAYSESKRMVEVMARSYYIQYGIESVIVRIGYVYGYTKSKPNTAFYEFIGKAVEGEDITINSTGMGRRDNIYVADVVNGLMTAALSGIPGEAYNIASNGEKDNFKAIDEIAQIIAEQTNAIRGGKKICVHAKEIREGRNPGLMLDNNKLKNLGWSLETDIREGIKETIKKYIEMR